MDMNIETLPKKDLKTRKYSMDMEDNITTHLRMKLHKSLQNQLHHRELENGKVFHARVLMKT